MLQDNLQTKYSGGTVFHVYLGEQVSNIETIKDLIKKITSKFRLPYFTLTPTFSVCPSHGYLDGKQEKCSICNHDTEVYSRVVGYLRPIKQWNNGKQAEFGMRKEFKIDLSSEKEHGKTFVITDYPTQELITEEQYKVLPQ